jgi:hypothetical protein
VKSLGHFFPSGLSLVQQMQAAPDPQLLSLSVMSSSSFLFFFLFLFNGIGVETQGFVLARQAPNCLSHCVSPFGSGCFAQRLSLFAQASLDLDLPF